MSELQDEIAALEEALGELEVRPAQLRRDPAGTTWLPPEWQGRVAAAPALARVVQRFVAEELALHESVRGHADALFTARVIAATAREEVAGAGLAPRTRAWILACAYALATAAALWVASPWLSGLPSGGIGRIVGPIHRVGHEVDRVAMTGVAGALVVATLVALGLRRRVRGAG